MFDMSILGQIAPILLVLGAGPLLYRVYLRIRHQLKGLTSFAISIGQLVLGTICVLATFFAMPYYDALTAGTLLLVGVADILIIVLAGGKFPLAALVAIGLGIIFGYMGAATAKYKVVVFFELFDRNIPEVYVGIALAVLIAAVAFVILRIFQDLLVAVAGILDFPLISLLIVAICLAQVFFLLAGSSLQPFLQELINQA